MSELEQLRRIAAMLALEVKHFGQCRGPLHQKLVDGKVPPCNCRHCQSLREWDAFSSIVQGKV